MSAETARVADGTQVTCLGTMVGVPAGTPAIVRHSGPDGPHSMPCRVYWLELDDHIHWSHGDSPRKGYWAVAAEFKVR